MVNPAYLLVDHLFVVNISFGFFVFISYLHFLHSWKPHKQAGKGEESVCLCGCRCRGRGKGAKWYASVSACSVYFCFLYLQRLLLLLLPVVASTYLSTYTNSDKFVAASVFIFMTCLFHHPDGGGLGEWLHLWFVLTAALNINKYFNNLFIYLLNHPLRDDMRLTFYILRINAFLRGYVFDLCNNCFEKHIKTNQLNFCFLLNFLLNIIYFISCHFSLVAFTVADFLASFSLSSIRRSWKHLCI